MFSRGSRTLIALALPLTLLLGACSDDDDGSPGQDVSASAKNSVAASVPTGKADSAAAPSPPASPLTTSITTEDGNKYTVTITPKAPDSNAVCAGTNSPGHMIIPFTLKVHNDSGKQVPQPRLGLAVSDDVDKQPKVVALSVPPVCIDFILTGEQLAPNADAVYEGSISNATASTKLTLNINNAGQGTPTTVAVPLFSGAR